MKFEVIGKKFRNGAISELYCTGTGMGGPFWRKRDEVISDILNGIKYVVPNPETELKVCLSTDPDQIESNNLSNVKQYS